MRLRCISRYRTARIAYEPGAEFEVSAAEGLALLADSPGSFERADAQPDPRVILQVAPDAPPRSTTPRARRKDAR